MDMTQPSNAAAATTTNVFRGAGRKVHLGILGQEGTRWAGQVVGTVCNYDVRMPSISHRHTVTSAPVDCKTCLGNVAAPAVEREPVAAPETCPDHAAGRRSGEPKTIKRGTYQGFSCGCRVWL
jgi:hypothetical protein